MTEAVDHYCAELGLVEHARREVGLTIAFQLADGLSVSVADLVDGVAGKHEGNLRDAAT